MINMRCKRIGFRGALALFAMRYTSAVVGGFPATLIFVNGAVYTVDAARTWASALVIAGDRIA
jgi:hypothetical protein